MNVDDLIREAGNKRWRQHAHVLRQHHIVRIVRFNGLRHQIVMLFAGVAFVAYQFEGNIKTLNQRAQRIVITDNGGNFNVQPAVVGFHQQIAQTMSFFGDQNHDFTTSGGSQFANGAFR
ncbi:hypothetical protein D3C71_1322890 [compost metagenome]